jgi:hypothetical protein
MEDHEPFIIVVAIGDDLRELDPLLRTDVAGVEGLLAGNRLDLEPALLELGEFGRSRLEFFPGNDELGAA